MKTIVALIVAFSSIAFAAETTILNTKIAGAQSLDRVEARFVTDEVTGEGSVAIKVSRHQSTRPTGNTIYRVLFNETIKVEGLTLHGDQLVLAADEGDIVCGTLGESRVLKRPTIRLSGRCILEGKIQRQVLTVKLLTK